MVTLLATLNPSVFKLPHCREVFAVRGWGPFRTTANDMLWLKVHFVSVLGAVRFDSTEPLNSPTGARPFCSILLRAPFGQAAPRLATKLGKHTLSRKLNPFLRIPIVTHGVSPRKRAFVHHYVGEGPALRGRLQERAAVFATVDLMSARCV